MHSSSYPNWEDPETYENLDSAGWAWEFLRRNNEYRAVALHPRDDINIVRHAPNLRVIEAAKTYDEVRRWGVRFR
jgi:hypothetical protein